MITRSELAKLMLNHYVNGPEGVTWLDAFNATMANLEQRGQVLAEEKREAISVACLLRRALVSCGLEEGAGFYRGGAEARSKTETTPLRSALGLSNHPTLNPKELHEQCAP